MRHVKTKLKFIMLLYLFSLPCQLIATGRGSPLPRCRHTQNVIKGAIEMYNIDYSEPIFSEGITELNNEHLAKLIKGRRTEYHRLQKQHGCQFFIIKPEKSHYIMICTVHGASINRHSRQNPAQQFTKLCDDNGISPDKYIHYFNENLHANIIGPPYLAKIVNLWYIFLVFPLLFFIAGCKRRFGQGKLNAIYYLGTTIVAFFMIMSIITTYYNGTPFYHTRASYSAIHPTGSITIAALCELLVLFWWPVSILHLIITLVRKKDFIISLTFVLCAPMVVMLIETLRLPPIKYLASLSLPVLGVILLYLMFLPNPYRLKKQITKT